MEAKHSSPWKLLFAIALLVFVAEWIVIPSRSHALPIAGAPQWTEPVKSPCFVATFVAGDGGIVEHARNFDSGVPDLRPGNRYRVYSDNKVYLSRAQWGAVTTCPVTCGNAGMDAGQTCDAAQAIPYARCLGAASNIAGVDGIPVNADSPEELSFSKASEHEGILYGQCAAGLTCKVSFCEITSSTSF
jgi:hypothetical protein